MITEITSQAPSQTNSIMTTILQLCVGYSYETCSVLLANTASHRGPYGSVHDTREVDPYCATKWAH
jgi:hypothetical protein